MPPKELADRYAELPEATREFLEELRPAEIALLAEAINFMRSAKTMGRFMKWTLLLIVGSFVTAASFGDAVAKVFSWLRGGAS